LADRRRLRFPPAVRVATVTGTLDAVTTALSTLEVESSDLLGPVDTEPGSVRTIVRFDYNAGTRVAAALRAEVIRNATTRRRAASVKGPRPPLPPSLRVRFDDVEPFSE